MTDNLHPGYILKNNFMDPRNISMKKLSNDTGIPFSEISEIIEGKLEITNDTAMLFDMYFGTKQDYWYNLQKNYFNYRWINRTA